ncbi:YveK family protein [Ethanoligenens harbinense]|uniref:Lipopolysaccharide biosynthesis protein n=1 Tax=Ethanoligenens harbinense (strain DSM 18485 / JCM 12961 / CGMCC 1.5033 / YUAN-3) TaxID=663278 RepID=E6U7N3_ETHHY|nr:Wzz/FepE/Etk N-terminal domain-containing protein [Ethanoligenens harbinense]ADU28156.1 lipopolysaccharide biosynthesis protein [Ethanoligenens harbinense YUAN-3]
MNETNEPTSYDQELDLGRLLLILKRGWLPILLASFLGLIVAFSLAAWAISPLYASSTMLVVNANNNQNNTTTITNDQLTTAQELVNTYSVILTSDTVLDQVISDLNLKTDASALAKNISVEGVNQTQVLKITVKDTNPQVAKNIANDIARVAPSIIIQTVKAGSVEVVSDAKLELKPVFPNIVLFSAIGLLIGFIGAYATLLVRDLLDHTFDSEEDVENRLGISVIGVIPVVQVKE